MLVKDLFYIFLLVISFMSIPILIYTINSNYKNKYIILIDKVYLIYLFVILVILPKALRLPIGFEIIIFYFLASIAVSIYIISFFICTTKPIENNISKCSKKIIFITIILIIFPIIIFSLAITRETMLIKKSDVILVYHYGGTEISNSRGDFGYAISDKFCKEFSIGVDFEGYYIKKFLPNTAIEVDKLNEISGYEIYMNEEDLKIVVEKDGKIIHNKKIRKSYYNISLEEIFSLRKTK